MQLFIRDDSFPFASQLQYLSLRIVALSSRKRISGFQIFLTVQAGSFDKGCSAFYWAGKQD